MSAAPSIARATIDQMIDRTRATQARIDRGELDGRSPAVQAECRAMLATADLYLESLPAADRPAVSRELVARLQATPATYVSTVAPRRPVEGAARL